MFKKCSKCGQLNLDANRFCENCGTRFSDSGTEKQKGVIDFQVVQEKILETVITEAISPRPFSEFLAIFTNDTLLYLLLLIAGLCTRFYALGDKPLHHDESLHAFYSYSFFTGLGYHYDPMMHGPFLFFSNALSYLFFGVNDFSVRIIPALFGVLLITLPCLFRETLGRRVALLLSFIFTFSPSFLYFSRFIRDDIYMVFGATLMVLGFFSWERTAKAKYLYYCAVGLGLSYCSMEATFITLSIFLPYIFLRFIWNNFFQKDSSGVSLFISVFKENLKKESFYLKFGLALIGALFLWVNICPDWGGFFGDLGNFLSVSNQKPEKSIWYPIMRLLYLNQSFAKYFVLSVWLILVTGIYASLGFYFKSLKIVFYFHLIFLGMVLVFYTVFFNVPNGLFDGFFRSWSYWLSQQPVARGSEPWNYYLYLLPLYEQFSILFGIIGFIIFLIRRSPLTNFLIWWTVGSFIAYGWAAEKMPWLILHMLLPLTFLACFCFGYLIDRANKNLKWFKVFLSIVFILLSLLLIHSSWCLSYYNASSPKEPLVYVQTTDDLKEATGVITRLSLKLTGGKELRVNCEGTCDWPFRWYLREFKNAVYFGAVANSDFPVVITSREGNNPQHDDQIRKVLGKDYVVQKYRLRVWWNWLDVNSIRFSSIVDWFLYRENWSGLGSSDFYLWVRKDVLESAQ